MNIQKYRKKPVEVSAIQWGGGNLAEVQWFVGAMENMDGDVRTVRFLGPLARDEDNEIIWHDGFARLWVEANKTWVPVEVGEWIIQDARGFYPCKADIFASTYEPVRRVVVG